MYTLFIGIGCYSLLNQDHMRRVMVNIGYSFANMLLSGFIIYNEHIYKPFNKYIYKPLSYILNIHEKEDEIMIIKDGVIIHSFHTMDDFIKQQPINFICDEDEDEDEDAVDESNEESNDKTEGDTNKHSNNESDGKIVDTIIDADLTQVSTDIHESKQGEGEGEGEGKSEEGGDQEEEEGEDEEEPEDDEEDEDDFILDPSEYDFLLRNVYYDNEKESERYCVCLKYETFCKSDTKKVFTNEELKSQLSKRKLIAINLHMNSTKYSIN
jgi:hypothetical protein